MNMHSRDSWNETDTKKLLKALKIAGIAIGIPLLLIALGFIVMFLWNSTIAAIFDLPTIGYWQAVGLFLLAKMFFGFGGGSSNSNSRSRKIKKRVDKGLKEVDFVKDEEFREFWKGEGKQAYEVYRASRNASDQSSD